MHASLTVAAEQLRMATMMIYSFAAASSTSLSASTIDEILMSYDKITMSYVAVTALRHRASFSSCHDDSDSDCRWTRLSKPCAQQLIRSDLMTSAVPSRELAAVRVPCLVMWGGSDRLVPPESLLYFAASLPPHAIVKLLPKVRLALRLLASAS